MAATRTKVLPRVVVITRLRNPKVDPLESFVGRACRVLGLYTPANQPDALEVRLIPEAGDDPTTKVFTESHLLFQDEYEIVGHLPMTTYPEN